MKLVYILVYILASSRTLVQGDTLTNWLDWLRERNVHCQDGRTNIQILQDDEFSQSYYNGSILDSMAKLGAKEVSQLMQYNSRARGGVTSCSMRQWGYADQQLYRLSNSPLTNGNLCREQLSEVYSFMKNISQDSTIDGPCEKRFKLSESHLYLQLTSFGRLPIGPPHHSDYWLGDYEQCLSLKDTRHCFGAFKRQPQKGDKLNNSRLYPREWGFIKVDLCLPDSCTEKIAQSSKYLTMIQEMVQFNLINGFNFTDSNLYKVTDIYCPPSAKSEWRRPTREPLSLILLILALLWILILFYCTSTRRTFGRKLTNHDDEAGSDWKLNFDLYFHWRKFFTVKQSSPELSCLDFAKVIGMQFIILNHSYLILLPLTRNYEVVRYKKIAEFLYQGQHSVSIFFMITSFFVSYVKFKRNSTVKPLAMIVKRYLRLIPMYLIVYAYTKQFVHLWASGPFWDHAVSPQSEMKLCKSESWLIPTLMLSNLVTINSHCVLTGWYVSTEFQTYMLLPIILFIYRKSRLMGRLICIGTLICSHLLHIWLYQTATNFSHQQLYRDPVLFGPNILALRLWYDYVNPLGRIGSAYLGVLLADLTYEWAVERSRNRIRNDHGTQGIELSPLEGCPLRSNGIEGIGTNEHEHKSHGERVSAGRGAPSKGTIKYLSQGVLLMGLNHLSIAFSGPWMPDYLKFELFGRYSKGISFTVSRFFNELGMFFVFYGLILKRQEQLEKLDSNLKQPKDYLSWQTFLNSPVWAILAKLNYTVMLTHFGIIKFLFQSSTQLYEFNHLNVCLWSLFLITICYISAGFIYICLEAPVIRLMKNLIDRLHKYLIQKPTAVRESQ